MLVKQGQLKIKNINGKIVAKPDLKTAIGSGATRKYAVAKKGIRYRKIYQTKESRYMYLLEDVVSFAAAVEKKKIDKTDAVLTGTVTGVGGGVGTGQGGTLGTTAVTFQQVNASGLTGSNFVDKEAPSGSYNGSNTTYGLANTPISGSEHVYLNGLLQEAGAGNDYTISSSTITMLTAPISGDKIRVSYRK